MDKEQQEKQEAAETKRKLDALEEAERQTKEATAKKQDEDAKRAAEASSEKEIEGELKRLSLDAEKALA